MTLIKFKNDAEKYTSRMPYFSDLFNDLFENMAFDSRRSSIPAVNVLENDDQFMLELAAPGLSKDDFKIEIDKDLLTIRAEKEEDTQSKKGRYNRRDFNFMSFTRSFNLPEVIDTDHISAEYENGVMRIAMPKRAEARPKPARVVKVS